MTKKKETQEIPEEVTKEQVQTGSEIQPENPEETDKEKVETTAKVNTPKVKDVEVRFLEAGTSIIAGNKYTYRKSQVSKVPTDVAAILVNSNLAIKL